MAVVAVSGASYTMLTDVAPAAVHRPVVPVPPPLAVLPAAPPGVPPSPTRTRALPRTTHPPQPPSTAQRPTPPPTSAPTTATPEPDEVPDCTIENRYDRDVEPHVRQVACALDEQFPGIVDLLGVGPGSVHGSDHPRGLAVDVVINQDRVTGDAIAACAARHFDDWGLSYVLWRQADLDKEGGEFEPMANRGSPTANHYNHVHLSFHPRDEPIPDSALTCDEEDRRALP